ARARGRHRAPVRVVAASRDALGAVGDAPGGRDGLDDRHRARARAEVVVLLGPELRAARVADLARGQEVAPARERPRSGLLVQAPAQLRVKDLERLVRDRRDLDVQVELVGVGRPGARREEQPREREGSPARPHDAPCELASARAGGAGGRRRARRSRRAVTSPTTMTTTSTSAAAPSPIHSPGTPPPPCATTGAAAAGARGAAATWNVTAARALVAAP